QQRGLIKGPFAEAAFTHSQIVSAGRYADHIRAWQEDFGTANVMILLYDDLRSDPQRYLDALTAFLGIVPINLARSPVTSSSVNHADRMPLSHRSARRARKLRDMLIRHRLYRLVHLGEPLFQACFSGGSPYPALDPVLELRLRHHLEPEVSKLEQLLKRDLSAWKPMPRQSSEAFEGTPRSTALPDGPST
ncbi:MAG TPA: sulfotransferase domain-containing protein, partial [Candidatus Binataceae bacterium]|nr:sulfotransferase domain-containing protein [Candidatus Binataceae bacterium]